MKLLISILIFTLLLSCDCKNEVIEPSKIAKLNNKEITVLTETLFVVSKVKGSSEILEKLSFLENKTFQFNKNGLVLSNSVKVGKWKNDRWIYFDAVDLRFLINFISKYEMKVYSQYIDCKKELLIEEKIYLKGSFINDTKLEKGLDF